MSGRSPQYQTRLTPRGVARGCGPHRAVNGRKLFFKIHQKIQIVISYVFACNKNKALQPQRVPILSILGYDIGSLAASGLTLLVLRQFCVGAGLYRIRSFLRWHDVTQNLRRKGGKFDHRPERPKVLLRHCFALQWFASVASAHCVH